MALSNKYGRLCKKEMVLKHAQAYGERLDLGLDQERERRGAPEGCRINGYHPQGWKAGGWNGTASGHPASRINL